MEEVKSSVKKILPTITNELLEKVLSVLQDLGVDNAQHLELVEEDDLTTVLKKIQARLLVKEWKKSKNNMITESSSELSSSELSSSESSSSYTNSTPVTVGVSKSCKDQTMMSVSCTFNPNKFIIPWESMPEELSSCLRQNTRPKPSLRNSMVRIIVDHIYKVTKKPGRKALSIIAERIVEKYPISFTDEISSEVNGTSHLSLLAQLERRCDNINRGDIVNLLKRKAKNENEHVKKIKSSDSYGCVQYQPNLPFSETTQSQIEKCQKMKVYASAHGPILNEECRSLLQDTYFSIRKDINSGKNLNFLITEWPFLFTKEGFLDHFNVLVGLDIEKKLSLAISKLGITIISYFLSEPKLKPCSKERFNNLVQELKGTIAQKENLYTWQVLITLLMLYLEDNMEVLFIIVEIGLTVCEVEMSIPNTPCLICFGDSVQNSSSFMLAVDSKIIMQDIKTFENGLAVLFAAFFCLNIQYPTSASTTLEFIQRCFLDINPTKGTKTDSSKKGKGVNPKIISLKKKITDFEWNL